MRDVDGNEQRREAIASRWNAVLSSAFALAWTGCGSSSSAPVPASNDGAPALSGDYDSPTGDRQTITFQDATHYSFVWRTCDAGAGMCVEDGTYALNDRRDTLTLTNAATGTSVSLPFAIESVGSASAQARPFGVAPLAEPPPNNPNPAPIASGGSPLLNVNNKPLVVQFSAGNDVFKIRTPAAIFGVRG